MENFGECEASGGDNHPLSRPWFTRFMESLFWLLRMHWGHEPRNWSAGLQPGAINVFLRRRTWRSWSPGLRFMESLLSLSRMHWGNEPRRGGRWRASVLDCGSPLPLLRPRARSESARGLAHSKTSRCAGWFMERLPGRKDDDRTVSGGGNEPQLFNTLSAFLASEARRISTPFLASGLVAE